MGAGQPKPYSHNPWYNKRVQGKLAPRPQRSAHRNEMRRQSDQAFFAISRRGRPFRLCHSLSVFSQAEKSPRDQLHRANTSALAASVLRSGACEVVAF